MFPDLINLTKVGVVAPDEISAVLFRSLFWGSEQIHDFEKKNRLMQSLERFHDSIKQNGSHTLSLQYTN